MPGALNGMRPEHGWEGGNMWIVRGGSHVFVALLRPSLVSNASDLLCSISVRSRFWA